MEEKFRNLPLRSGVGIVVLNKENKVFVAKRIDNPKNFWQMPQGGVDDGEEFLAAAYRELEEETSIKNVELVKEIEGTITYELPKNLLGIIWKGKYKGQKQKWFLMRYLGKDEDINQAVESAKKAYESRILVDMNPMERAKLMRRIAEELRKVSKEGGAL